MMDATQLFDALPDARGNPDRAQAIMRTINSRYGDEGRFFQAVAKELGVSPDDVATTLVKMSQAAPQEDNQQVQNTQQPVQQPAPRQPRAPQQLPASLKTNTRPESATPPRAIDPVATQQTNQNLQQSGMAPSQAMAKAAAQPQNALAPIKMKEGGMATKKRGVIAPPPSAENIKAKLASYSADDIPPNAMEGMERFMPKGYKEEKARGLVTKKESTPAPHPVSQDDGSTDAFEDEKEKWKTLEGIGYAEGGAIDDPELPMTTEAEQADDVPAMLSEGEFVFPAYAVKYYGVKHLEEMLDMAKAEMMEMEEEQESPEDEANESPDMQEFEDEYGLEEHESPEEFAKGGKVKVKVGRTPSAKAIKNAGYKGVFKAAPTMMKEAHVPRGPNTMPYGLQASPGELDPNKGIKMKRGGLLKIKMRGC